MASIEELEAQLKAAKAAQKAAQPPKERKKAPPRQFGGACNGGTCARCGAEYHGCGQKIPLSASIKPENVQAKLDAARKQLEKAEALAAKAASAGTIQTPTNGLGANGVGAPIVR